jgi:hypothetical protein
LLSRADKSKPNSPFKRIYLAARQQRNGWLAVFLPWTARPDRDAAWYDAQRRDVLARTGGLDDLAEQYPETDTEALAPRSLDKRLPAAWLQQCYAEQAPLAALPKEAPAIPGLAVFALPQPGRKYVLGVDPAEGNPTSDDSTLCVLEAGAVKPTIDAGGRMILLSRSDKSKPNSPFKRIYLAARQQLNGWLALLGISSGACWWRTLAPRRPLAPAITRSVGTAPTM